MSVMSDMLPSDAAEQAKIKRILREQPDLAAMIETAQARAREVFAEPRFSLDTHGYDDWDPPLRLVSGPMSRRKASMPPFSATSTGSGRNPVSISTA